MACRISLRASHNVHSNIAARAAREPQMSSGATAANAMSDASDSEPHSNAFLRYY